MAGALQAGPSAGSVPGIEIPEMPQIDFARFGEIERQPLSRIQKISGPSLHRSWLHVPHVTQHDEADITDLEAFRQDNKAKAKEEGFSLTPLAFIMKATVAALEEYPAVNSSLDAESGELVLKKYYHLGVAVDTPGGLVVPVIRDVDCKGVMDLARELAEVSATAREGKLKLDQLQGASFTITSLGGIGGTAFTPIVNAPEVGILGVSRSYRKPVWQDDDNGGGFAPRLMLPLSFSYDHRAVDGATAVRFTTFLTRELADIRRLVL
jgi:pyruvate dehydrogenase E2 component (dihydrolipoamide acetyltransferase)